MRKIILFLSGLAVAATIFAQTPAKVKFHFTEASDLTLCGKIFHDTPNPYHRVDTCVYKGFTRSENGQVRMSSGISVAFKTNSTVITVKTTYVKPSFPTNGNGFSARGYDLYIREGGKWMYAASGVQSDSKLGQNLVLIDQMAQGRTYECLLYLPLYSELSSVQIGVQEGADIKPLPNPFRHRIAIFGSSYTHGSSTTRAGMTYPAQLGRNTGLQMLSLGCSGNSKLQSYFCDVLCGAKDIDAFVFDGFSNPSAAMIKDRLFPFIEKLQAAHPGVPLIFQQTIWRETRRFRVDKEAFEAAKMAMADSLMKIAVKKYKDVYFIYPDPVPESHNATVDGVHPDNYGYTLWAESIEKPLLRILRKYGIK